MKPTIGRIVHYVTQNTHVAAMVIAVNQDGAFVDLETHPSPSMPLTVPKYVLNVTESTVGTDGTWHWPERED